ncbi:hypothetical protein H6P81_006035 [Aristolochia fimbriata]|uniref:NAC domain-containing protein n=1 Tax=Aristolochia fimbriata TaxID=158543 RepID=A0AAV7EZ08_ARIFI|nr:hypothetical protein H6P81_006035 [Aristolochia fimbriata]
MSSLSVNGQARVPPGFRFHPTEEELLNYYLRKKVACEKIDLDVIRDVDLNKLEPWDIQEKCRIGSTPQNDWYFFSHKDKKYPTGTRTNRATAAGFWKATGRDKVIYTNFKRIGMRKTLVFYKGRAPHGQKSDWIMHEYRLEDHSADQINSQSNIGAAGGVESAQEDGWVVCRVFKKKNHHKAIDSPNNSSSVTSGDVMNGGAGQMVQYSSTSNGGDGALDQILQYMGRTCKQEKEPSSNKGLRFDGREMLADTSTTTAHERFMQLPPLESPCSTVVVPPAGSIQHGGRYAAPDHVQIGHYSENINIINPLSIPYGSDDQAAGTHHQHHLHHHHLGDWATLDRLVASHLNGGEEAAETSKQLASCFNGDPSFSSFCSAASDSEIPFPSHLIRSSINNHNDELADLWTFARPASSSSDHFPSCTTQTPLPN